MDVTFWKKVASMWCDVQSEEDQKRIESLVAELFASAQKNRREEKLLIDEILSGLDEEDDYGY